MPPSDITHASLRELQDRLAIQDLLYHYAELVDFGHNHRIAKEIFAPDGVADFGSAQITGFAQLHDFYQNSPLFTKFPQDMDGFRHDITNVRIRFDAPERAQSIARVTAWCWNKSARPAGKTRAADLVITGVYRDNLVRLPEGWRISRRRGGQFGTGVGAGNCPREMQDLLAGMLGRIPTWDDDWIDTPFLHDYPN
jgi:hypothetical protein